MADDTALLVSTSDPLPMVTTVQAEQALTQYLALQATFDRLMPDQIMEIEGRAFRKKGYWRAIRLACNLRVEMVDERREVHGTFEDGQENFGYTVNYRATAPNGQSAGGDGACFAIEKAPKGARWRALPPQATEHNVRSHAHTRAFNRAVSNLVGFGEVSAEEIERDDHRDDLDVPVAKARARVSAALNVALPKCPHCGATGIEKDGEYGPYFSCPEWKSHPPLTKPWFLDRKKWEADPRSRLTTEKLVPPSFMREPGDEPPF